MSDLFPQVRGLVPHSETPPVAIDLYPSEVNALKSMAAVLQDRYGFRSFDGPTVSAFAAEAVSRGRDLGLILAVSWGDAATDDSSEPTVYYLPTITVTGRVDPAETDHDRMAAEVRAGEADGVAGVIRADGSRREDPRRRTL